MTEYLFVGRLAFTSILLAYAAWSDLAKREVENWVPVALVVGGVCFATSDAVIIGDPLPVILALVTAAVSFGIALAIFYAGSMGGADCKIFIGVSTVFPLLISSPLPLLSEVNPYVSGTRRILPFFSLSWLINSLLISLVVPVGLLTRNLVDLLRGRISEVNRRTILAFFVGYRARVDSLRSSFVIPLERFEEVGGREVRVLRFSRGVLDEEEEVKLIARVKERFRGDELIWAFPYIPFIVPMLIALFVTMLFGDLLVNLASGL